MRTKFLFLFVFLILRLAVIIIRSDQFLLVRKNYRENINEGEFFLKVKTEVQSEIQPEKRRSIFGGSDVPVNLNFPNKKGVDGYDPEMPLKEIIAETPKVTKEHLKVCALISLHLICGDMNNKLRTSLFSLRKNWA